MRDHRLWHWLVEFAAPIVMADAKIQRGDVVTARELVPLLTGLIRSVSTDEAFEVSIATIEHLIERGVLKPQKCKHGMVRVFAPCDECGHAAKSVLPSFERRSTAEVRDRIWQVLIAHPDGLTRGELARRSGEPEKTVCWAIRDWVTEGRCVVTGESRKMESGRLARVIRPR